MKEAALDYKKQQVAMAARKKAQAGFMRTRFTTGASAEQVQRFDAALAAHFGTDGTGLKVEQFSDVLSWFGGDAEGMRRNTPYALMLTLRRVLHQATSEEKLRTAIANATPVLRHVLSVLSTACTDPLDVFGEEEFLYAGCHVVGAEMRDIQKRLPDYGVDSSVAECFFYECYMNGLVSEDAVLRWFDDADDETSGRMDVSFQVAPFLTFLRPPNDGDDDENSSDESDRGEEF